MFSVKALPYFQRKEILLECASEIRNRREELAKVLCVEAGKPIKDARVEIDVSKGSEENGKEGEEGEEARKEGGRRGGT